MAMTIKKNKSTNTNSTKDGLSAQVISDFTSTFS